MSIKKIISIFLLTAPAWIFAQQLIQTKPVFFSSILDGKEYINSYYVGSNPAFLKLEVSDQRLCIGSFFNRTNGDFKTFFTPGSEKFYQLTFSGKKEITETQIFKGAFSFIKNERDDWNWLATKMYDTGSPFLFGDSTSGSTRYNVMKMSAQYSAEVFDNLLAGFAIDYSVDEGLKTVSPRPTTEHRDIIMNFGVGYYFNSNTSAGISLKAYDYNEKITYAEDEGAIYTATILFKFRGYDFPSRLLKKTETRYSYHNKYLLSADVQHLADDFVFSGVVGIGEENISLSEGSNDPIQSGFYRSDLFFGSFKMQYKFSDLLTGGLYYSFNQKSSWARHPNYNIVIGEEKNPFHKLGAGVEVKLNSQLSFGIELESSFSKREVDDYFSAVYWSADLTDLTPRFGVNYRWSENLSTFIGFEHSAHGTGNKSLTAGGNSVYFTNYRMLDIQYYLNDFTSNSLFLKTDLNFEEIGSFYLYLNYKSIKPASTNYFPDAWRNQFNVGLEYRIQVY